MKRRQTMGLINAVQKVWPDAEHRFCVRHLLQNFQKAGHQGETLKNDLWAIARSTSIPKWQKTMDKLKVDSEAAHAWIEELVPNTWIKAFFSEFPKCDMLLNNHSEVFNSYILQAREMPQLSMLETVFYKIMQRMHTKARESGKWTGRICPKIKKKLQKFTEWSADCIVRPAGDHLFSVNSHEMEQNYSVDLKAKTCDCKRWQLSGLPCHHVIACCRTKRINPETLVHNCYTIEAHIKAYSFNLAPLRGRPFWKKMNGPIIHPPLFTKVMGRPKKNRKKAPEEKMKNGVKKFTKSGVTMHCSICGVANHNKKGHYKYVQSQMEQQQEENASEEVEEMDYMQHLPAQHRIPTLDPTHQLDSMVYSLGQEANDQEPVHNHHGPLPESAFVADARESIPQTRVRVTTATTRGRGRGRPRNVPVVLEDQLPEKQCKRGRGRPTAVRQAPKEQTNIRRSAPRQATGATSATGATAKRKLPYNTGLGSAFHLLFGDDQQHNSRAIPDLNDDVMADFDVQEVPLSQNAPTAEL